MRTKTLATAALLASAVSVSVVAQQTQAQDDQSGTARQTTSAGWSSTTSGPPEQAGDLYQAKGRGSGNVGGAPAPDDSILPGALTPGAEPVDSTGRTDRKD